MSEKLDPKTLFRSPDAVAVVADASELFGLLTRSLELPSEWTALVTRLQGDRVVYAPGRTVPADDVLDVLLVRTSPWVLAYEGLTATSVDHYQCSAAAAVRVSIIPDRAELRSFRNTVVGSARWVRKRDLLRYFEPSVTSALGRCAEGRGVAVLIDAQTSETLASELAASLKGPAFTAGMKVEGPVTVRFDSPVYRQVSRSRAESQRRREQFEARRQIERAAEEARRRHAEHLTQLLTTLREQADSVSEVELSALFKTFCDADRGELYAALFAADEGRPRTRSIVVGSGKGLLFFAPDALDRPERSLMLPDGVGPVRSVQVQVDAAGAHCLFVGASCGVHELAADGTGDITTYDAGDQTQVRGGVNSVALAGDHVWATHSELGLLRWRRGAEAGVERVLADRTQGAQAVRCVQFHDGDLYLAADHSVLRIRADDPGGDVATLTGSGSLITAICPAADGLYAGNADGQVLHWEPGNDDQPTVLHAGRRRAAESVTIQEYGGIGRLLYTDTSLAVFARVIGDTIVTRYEAGGQTLRRVEAAPDLIVATNEVRDRLICWKPGAPATPCGVVTVGRLTGHSIQDVCLAPCV